MRNRRLPDARAALLARVLVVLRALLARGAALLRVVGPRLRALALRLRDVIRTLRTGPLPTLEAEAAARPGPVHGAEGPADAEGRPAAVTIVPSTRWEGLDRALGRGRERWRNVATAAVAVTALVLAVSVLWSSGEGEGADAGALVADGATEAGGAGLFPTMVFDEPVGDEEIVVDLGAVGGGDDPVEVEPLPEGVPSGIAYGAPVPAPAGNPPAARPAVAGAAPAPPAAPEVAQAVPAAVAEPAETAPAPVPEVDPEEAARLAQAAGCPDGTLPTEVLPGDTVGTIAWRHAGPEGKNLIRDILQANTKLKPERMQPGDLVCVPRVDRVIVAYKNETYTIQRGDTIARMADRFQHLTRANLMALTTRARKKDMLYAGREVTLPMPRYASRP